MYFDGFGIPHNEQCEEPVLRAFYNRLRESTARELAEDAGVRFECDGNCAGLQAECPWRKKAGNGT